MWRSDVSDLPDFQKSQIFDLILVILEGPLPNVVKREQLPSMSKVIEILRNYHGTSLLGKLRVHRQSNDSFLNAKRHQDFLYDNRTVYNGLLSIESLGEKRTNRAVCRTATPYMSASSAFADLLEETQLCITEFYKVTNLSRRSPQNYQRMRQMRTFCQDPRFHTLVNGVVHILLLFARSSWTQLLALSVTIQCPEHTI